MQAVRYFKRIRHAAEQESFQRADKSAGESGQREVNGGQHSEDDEGQGPHRHAAKGQRISDLFIQHIRKYLHEIDRTEIFFIEVSPKCPCRKTPPP